MAPPEMGLSPLVGLLKILMAVSLAHSLKHALNIFDERFKVRRRRNRENTKNNVIFFLFGGGDGGQNQLLT